MLLRSITIIYGGAAHHRYCTRLFAAQITSIIAWAFGPGILKNTLSMAPGHYNCCAIIMLQGPLGPGPEAYNCCT